MFMKVYTSNPSHMCSLTVIHVANLDCADEKKMWVFVSCILYNICCSLCSLWPASFMYVYHGHKGCMEFIAPKHKGTKRAKCNKFHASWVPMHDKTILSTCISRGCSYHRYIHTLEKKRKDNLILLKRHTKLLSRTGSWMWIKLLIVSWLKGVVKLMMVR